MDTIVKPARIRAAVAKAMVVSAATPQFAVDWDVDAAALFDVRAELQGQPSVADLVNLAVVRALAEHPRLNAAWIDGQIVEFADVNLGVAVAVDDGIIAPAILSAQSLSLAEVAAARKDLQAAAAGGSLTVEQMTSATFTVSNLGTVGVSRVQPLVIPPQAAILGVPARRRSGDITLCLACDHRVTDGLPASLFLRDLAELLENPSWLRDA